MELSEFRRRYHDAQNRFHDNLQAITTAIEIVTAINSQNLRSVNQALQIINDYIPQVLTNYEDLTAIVDEFFNSQSPQNTHLPQLTATGREVVQGALAISSTHKISLSWNTLCQSLFLTPWEDDDTLRH